MRFRTANGWKWAVALAAVFVPALVLGANELPYSFKAGTPIKAAEMNANFEALRSRIDALAAPAAVDVGTVTLGTILADAPIHKFSSSIEVPFTANAPTGKTAVSNITFERDVGPGSVELNVNASNRATIPAASFKLGNLTIDLKNVVISSFAVTPARADKPQEAVSLSFTDITWTWQNSDQTSVAYTWNVPKAVGGSASVRSYTFGFFPAGLAADGSHTPILSYTYKIACAVEGPTCKTIHSPVVVQKRADVGTLYALGAALTSKAGQTVDLDWFNLDGSINNGLSLSDAAISAVSLTTAPDGSLVETTSFNYAQIDWKVGAKEAGWDVVKAGPI